MGEIKQYEPLWGSWYIESLIGEGSFGKVYKVCRKEYGKTYYSAVKIISIPHDQAEIRQIRNQGLDDASMRNFLLAHVKDILSEIDMLNSLHGNTHIVSFKDHKVIEKTDTFGWDILIRMELLTNLSDYSLQNPMTHAEIIKMGIHICRALELCAKNNIIHRDIKSDNIFVSQHGDYKLGDFGIARQVERTMSGMSKKGTYSTMAPEVFKGKPYGASVDTYALGIVMYSLLNKSRPPFMPEYPQPIVPNDRDNALNRRMKGDPVPPLANVGPELNAIILKACAFSREDRFTNPTEMRASLEIVAGMQQYVSETSGRAGRASGQGQDGTLRLVPESTDGMYYENVSTNNENYSVPDQRLEHEPVSSIGEKEHITDRLEFASGGGIVGDDRPQVAPALKQTHKKRTLLIACCAFSVVILALVAAFVTGILPGFGSDRSVTGCGISIDGQIEFVLSDQDEAQAVLAELADYYTEQLRTISNEVSSVEHLEKVEYIETKDVSQRIMGRQEVLQALIKGKPQTFEHAVIEGETIQDISKKYEVATDALLAENEGIEETLAEGPAVIELNIMLPYLNVIVKGKGILIEDIEFETETKKDDNLLWDEVKISQPGEKGSKNTACTYTSRNGVVTGKIVQDEEITKQPVKEVVLKGAKSVVCSFDSKGITSEKLAAMVKSGEIPYNVSELHLASNSLTDISPLKSLTGLKVLGLGNNNISDLTPLESLANLTMLDLNSNNFRDITPLKSLTSLELLGLISNDISESQCIELEAALPYCGIIYKLDLGPGIWMPAPAW
ncbi:MAG: protein kinase [Peptococcaceae bacterium]|nr:protein kinase [Peptococcaceae bacterium]